LLFVYPSEGYYLMQMIRIFLKYCENNSIQPLICTLLKLKTPYPTCNAYTYASPDSLHTLITGLMKALILWSMTIIERVGMYGVYCCS
jgi:hypothetical protein